MRAAACFPRASFVTSFLLQPAHRNLCPGDTEYVILCRVQAIPLSMNRKSIRMERANRVASFSDRLLQGASMDEIKSIPVELDLTGCEPLFLWGLAASSPRLNRRAVTASCGPMSCVPAGAGHYRANMPEVDEPGWTARTSTFVHPRRDHQDPGWGEGIVLIL